MTGVAVVALLTACSGAGEGELDPSAGATYEEQLQEMELVTEAFEGAFDGDFALNNDEPWSIEAYEDLRGPRMCQSRGAYNNTLRVTASDLGTPEENEERVREAAHRLGMDNTSDPRADQFNEDLTWMHASSDGRGLRVQLLDDTVSVRFSTVCSDDDSLEEAYERLR